MSKLELRVRSSALLVFAVACLSTSTACSDKSPKTSSESNWLKCVNDADCARVAGAICSLEERVCVTPNGSPIPGADAPDASAARATASDSHDAATSAAQATDAALPDSSGTDDGSTRLDAAAPNLTTEQDASTSSSDTGLADSDAATADPNLGDTGSDSATEASSCPALAYDTWLPIDGPDVAWPEPGREIYSPDAFPDLAELVLGDTLFVLDQNTARLFAFDACNAAWSEHPVPAEFPVSTATRAQNGRFVTWQGEAEYPTFDPITGAQEQRPVSEFQGAPTSIDWPEPQSEGSRQASSGVAWPYTLYFGGAVRTTDEERQNGLPDVLVFGDGQLYDARTAGLQRVNDTGAPSPRVQAKIFPLGERFMVWGGFAEAEDMLPVAESELFDGAIYDPESDTWSAVTTMNAPAQPAASTLFSSQDPMLSTWTGSYLLVVGSSGPRVYDPAVDEWRSVTGGDGLRGNGAAIGATRYAEMSATESLVLDLVNASVESRAVGLTPAPLASDIAALEELGGVGWQIDVWVGAKRVRWGAAAFWEEGCDNPPPDQGCDPLAVGQTIEGGAFVQFADD